MIQIILLTLLALQCPALFTENSNVIELTNSNFDAEVVNSDKVWIVEFFAPWCGHCQNFVPEYEQIAKALKGIISVGAVDIEKHKSLVERFSVHGFPTIKIFGFNKAEPEQYNGQRSAKAIIDATLSVVRTMIYQKLGIPNSNEVIKLTDDNFDKLVLESQDIWLIEFFAPWCGHCQKLGPQWKQAASDLKGKVKLGAIDATIHTLVANRYKIQGYPTIKYFPQGVKTLDSGYDYDGGRIAGNIVKWALDKAEETVSLKVVQILNEAVFKTVCDQKSLCIVAFLPHIFDCLAECRNNYLDILEYVGKKYKTNLWGWAWSEAGAQINLENALEIGGFGYPTLAVINTKKMKYSSLRGSFSKIGIDEFLRDISYGRGYTAPIKGSQLPTIINVEPWNGKDSLPIEEQQETHTQPDISSSTKDEL